MTTGRLILTPVDPFLLLEADTLITSLGHLGLISSPLTHENHFSAGERFMQLIAFTGCSPFLRFEPNGDDDEDFCHIRLSFFPEPLPAFYSGSTTKPPACPHCKKGLAQWRSWVSAWHEECSSFSCPHCGESLQITELNWRKHAGFGRSIVEIFSVFPGEAAPLTSFLDDLHRATGNEWRYFYVQ